MDPRPFNQRFDSIEGLRGILALIVCFGHFGFAQLFHRLGLQFNLHFAVDIFFVISGFVLAHSNYYATSLSDNKVTGFEFTLKRFARLYPLHLLTLLIMCFINAINQRDMQLTDFAQHLLLIQNWGLTPIDNGYNFPNWSISVEMWCSLLFFAIVAVVKNRKIMAILSGISVLGVSLFQPQWIMSGDYENTLGLLNVGMLRGIVGMSLGIGVYLSLQSTWWKTQLQRSWVGYLCLFGLMLFLFVEVPIQNAILFYTLTYGLIAHMAIRSEFLSLLSTKIMVGLGAISYAIYLLHIPLYKLLQTCWGDAAVKGWGGKMILLPLLLSLAYFIYRYFERSAQRWILSLYHRYSLMREMAHE